MHRRDFLRLTALGTGSLAGLALPGHAAPSEKPRPNVTIITGVDANASPSHLRAVLDSLLSLSLPAACVVDPSVKGGPALTPDTQVAQTLRDFADRYTGLFEIVAHSPGLAGLTPYAQARNAYETRVSLLEALGYAQDAPPAAALVQSIASDAMNSPLAPAGLRAAGFRSALVVGEETHPVISETWEDGTIRLFGGAVGDIATATDMVGQPLHDQAIDLNYLPVTGFENRTPQEAGLSAAIYARTALDKEMLGRISNQRLADLILRDDFRFTRLIGLHVFDPPTDAPDLAAGVAAFRAELSALNFAFSFGPLPGPQASETSFWVPDPSRQDTDAGNPAWPLLRDPTGKDPFGLHAEFTGQVGGIQGIDQNARLSLPVLALSDFAQGLPRTTRRSLSTSEFVLTIAPESLATRPGRALARRRLIELDQQGVAEFVPVQTFAQSRYPKSNLIRRRQQVEAARPVTTKRRRSVEGQKREALLADARHAWSYIETLTHPHSGLCPATVSERGGGKTLLEAVTMWDIASHINALVAAASLEFLTPEEFRTRTAKIMPNIKGRTTDGRHLPQEWVRTDRVKWGNRNFDACDAGRLLAALKNLAAHPLTEVDVAALVETWSLDQVVIEGEIHSVIDRKTETVFRSHCAHYAARAFRHWGVAAKSPYEVMVGKSGPDGQMALLQVANSIGVIGTEPLLLEAMDFGLSPETAFLAETLFTAQMREYEATGTLTCVSESPINRQPWFTFQGLNLASFTKQWVVEPDDENEAFQSDAFKQEVRSLSPKGAYLWAAHHPHEYSDRLMSFIRENGKTRLGFVSSYYTQTGQPTVGYSDLNTNGIILQAIAKMLV